MIGREAHLTHASDTNVNGTQHDQQGGAFSAPSETQDGDRKGARKHWKNGANEFPRLPTEKQNERSPLIGYHTANPVLIKDIGARTRQRVANNRLHPILEGI